MNKTEIRLSLKLRNRISILTTSPTNYFIDSDPQSFTELYTQPNGPGQLTL